MKYSEFLKTLSQAYTAFVEEGRGGLDSAYMCIVLDSPETKSEKWIERKFEEISGTYISLQPSSVTSLKNSIIETQCKYCCDFGAIVSVGTEYNTRERYIKGNTNRAKWLMGLALQEEALGN